MIRNILITFLTSLAVASPPDSCRQSTWVPDGPVYAMAAANGRLYLGGGFTHIAPFTGCGVTLDSANCLPPESFDRIDGFLNCCCADGSGGWFVGGMFNMVGGVVRKSLAHLLGSGKVDANWSADVDIKDGLVLDLALDGDKLYICGRFSHVGGQPHHGVACIDAATGAITSWNPAIIGRNSQQPVVYTVAVNGSRLYIGGNFDSVGGMHLPWIAALDKETGAALDWSPNPNNEVRCIKAVDSVVYAGGTFDSIGGSSRPRIAQLSASTGAATAWDASLWSIHQTTVSAIEVSGTTVYIGGRFDYFGETDDKFRSNIAAFDATTGKVTDWNPRADSAVFALRIDGSKMYAGGRFARIGGLPRKGIAALDLSTGNATEWSTLLGGRTYYGVNCIDVQGRKVFAGGQFNTIGGVYRGRIAVIDQFTGAPAENIGNVAGDVYCLALNGSTLYIGGRFSSVNAEERRYLAAFDISTATVKPWNPEIMEQQAIYGLAVHGPAVYAGGRKNTIQAYDTSNGATLWETSCKGVEVRAIAAQGNMVYAGGWFDTVQGQQRDNVVALDATTGSVTDFANFRREVALRMHVQTIALNGPTIFLGGSISTYGLIEVDALTGKGTGYAGLAGNVIALGQSTSSLYVGGKSFVIELEKDKKTFTPWEPGTIDSAVKCITVCGNAVYVGGEFTSIGSGVGHPYFAQFGEYDPFSTGTINREAIVPPPATAGFAVLGATLTYTLQRPSPVRIEMITLQGKRVFYRSVHEVQGFHAVALHPLAPAGTGVYIIRFEAGGLAGVQRVILRR